MHTTRYGPVAILFAMVCGLAHAAVREITPDDLAFFLGESYSRYSRETDPNDLEDQFYRIATDAGSPEAAVRKFAELLGIGEERAAGYAVALIESVRFHERCEDARSENACAFAPGEPLYDALLDAGFADETGRIATIIGKYIPRRRIEQRHAVHAFVAIASKHPAHAAILSQLFAYGKNPVFLAALLSNDPPSAATAALARWGAGRYQSCTTEDSGTLIALLEVARNRARSAEPADSETSDLLLTEAMIRLELKTGLIADAVEAYEARANQLDAHLALSAPAFVDLDQRKDYSSDSAELAVDMAYAVFQAGDREAARRLLAVRAALKGPAGAGDRFDVISAALEEAMSPRLTADELYDVYIYDRTAEGPDLADLDLDYGLAGWLFRLRDRPAVARSVIAARLRAAGYEGMAIFLYEPGSPRCMRDDIPIFQSGEPMISSLGNRKDFWIRKIQSTWDTLDTLREKKVPETDTHIYRGPNPLVFEERELPTEYVRPASDEEPGEAAIPEDVVLPADRPSVVRYANEHGEQQIVYLSSAIDRPGEIPALGFWFQQTSGGGKQWGAPLYLGLQQFFPYVVVPDSKLPLLTGGHLRIEVEAREIDPASITFPPVGLALKRKQRDLYIDFDLDDLSQDSDDDGMTDIVEYKLGLNPLQADTDGDGIVDGADSLPLTPYDAKTPAEYTELAAAIIKAVYGYEQAAIMENPREPSADGDISDALKNMQTRKAEPNTLMMIAEPKYFTGLRLFDQLLIYSEADVELLDKGPALFFPVRLSAIFAKKNGREFYVSWSASWTGGAFTVRCREGECDVDVIWNWIT